MFIHLLKQLKQITMGKTKFVSVDDTQKKKKETVFTHYLDEENGWEHAANEPTEYEKVVYLGECEMDGDMFAVYIDGNILIFKGIKGDEF